MRLGYSPGWVGRSPTGLPPTAEWLMSSGLLPQFRQYLAMGVAPPVPPPAAPTGPALTREQEIQMLEQQAKAVEAQLEATRKRLEAVRQRPATQQGAQPYYPYYPPAPYGYPPTPYTPHTPPSPEDELASLEDYRRELDEEAKGVEARIEELKKLLEKKKTP
ncbi:MAG: DUF5320 domain-containing protein [Candidatus Bathyarchaeia archaeon]